MYQLCIPEQEITPKASCIKIIAISHLSVYVSLEFGSTWNRGFASRSLITLQLDAGQRGSHLKAWLEPEDPLR